MTWNFNDKFQKTETRQMKQKDLKTLRKSPKTKAGPIHKSIDNSIKQAFLLSPYSKSEFSADS